MTKQIPETARRGIRGEAYFESLIVEHALPHRINREKDVGTDFLCEWIFGDVPTGLLFSAQVKTTTRNTVTPCLLGQEHELNHLQEYQMKKASSIAQISNETIDYWKGLNLPAYVFLVLEGETLSDGLECYYKRYTPKIDGRIGSQKWSSTKPFFQVSNGARFLAFADTEEQTGGFARDLMMDYLRLSYARGHLLDLTPDTFGFWPWKQDVPQEFLSPLKWNKKVLNCTLERTEAQLKKIDK